MDHCGALQLSVTISDIDDAPIREGWHDQSCNGCGNGVLVGRRLEGRRSRSLEQRAILDLRADVLDGNENELLAMSREVDSLAAQQQGSGAGVGNRLFQFEIVESRLIR